MVPNTKIQTTTRIADSTVPSSFKPLESNEFPRAMVAVTNAVFGKTKEYLVLLVQ